MMARLSPCPWRCVAILGMALGGLVWDLAGPGGGPDSVSSGSRELLLDRCATSSSGRRRFALDDVRFRACVRRHSLPHRRPAACPSRPRRVSRRRVR